MAKTYIVDGNSLLFRAYYATAYGPNPSLMRTKEGIPTNAVFSFGNMINKILNTLKEGDTLFVGFDTGKATFRHEEDKDYKANRKPCPEDLKVQMPIVRELLKALSIYTFELEGYEGDDLCGTIAKEAGSKGYEVIIYTSDKDFLQLVDENIQVQLLKTGMSNMQVITPETMQVAFGFSPMQIIDYKGLRGDTSDNLPGIPGIGEKTAVKLLQEYGTLEKIIEAAPSFKSKVGESIIANQEMGRKCRHLAEIDTHVKLPFTVEDTKYNGYEFKEIAEFCNKYELKQFLNRLSTKFKRDSSLQDIIEVVEITSFKDVQFNEEVGIALDIEPGNYNDAEINGIAISTNNKDYYINIDDAKKDEILLKVLASKEYKKFCFDFKSIKVALSHLNIKIDGLFFDLLLASYLLDSSLTNNVDSIMRYYSLDIASSKDESLSLFDNRDPQRAAKIAHYSHSLYKKVVAELVKLNEFELLTTIELPLADVLADMEIEGFPLDKEILLNMGETFKLEVEKYKKIIYELAGEEFNIDSPKQVGNILFSKLGLNSGKGDSTSVDVLKDLAEKHPIVNNILQYRKYQKLLTTYVTGLTSHIKSDGKIHAMFNQALTATGRLSSSEPNLQNISIRDEEGKLIRKAFYYKEDNCSILSLDYSQIELRILASLSGCKALQDVFSQNLDIHSETAKRVFNTDSPTDSERRRAKAVNFGIIYGISDWGLAEQIDCSLKEAKQIIDSFYEAYPEIGRYFQKVTFEANRDGYVTTLMGRRRYLRELHDANYQVREFARRAAMNAPIQGTAADLIKIAMIKVHSLVKEKGLKSKLTLQIHDELLFKVYDDEKDEVFTLVKNAMENALQLDVKFEVDGGFGHTWYDAK